MDTILLIKLHAYVYFQQTVLILHCMPVVMLICLISYLCRLKALKSLCCTVACAPTLNNSCLMSCLMSLSPFPQVTKSYMTLPPPPPPPPRCRVSFVVSTSSLRIESNAHRENLYLKGDALKTFPFSIGYNVKMRDFSSKFSSKNE